MPMDAENHYAVEGLSPPVEIRVERWGVPRVYASSAGDAFFAQGRGAARDRLWQIDLWRGLGLLSEAFLYRGEMHRDSSEESPTRIRWSAPTRIPATTVAGTTPWIPRDRRPTSLPET
jgi:hypothetical protein